jgi:hypothetical protein
MSESAGWCITKHEILNHDSPALIGWEPRSACLPAGQELADLMAANMKFGVAFRVVRVANGLLQLWEKTPSQAFWEN